MGFGGGNCIAWVIACFRAWVMAWLRALGLVLLFAAPQRGVDLWLDGRGRGLRLGWGEAAVRKQVVAILSLNQVNPLPEKQEQAGIAAGWDHEWGDEKVPQCYGVPRISR